MKLKNQTLHAVPKLQSRQTWWDIHVWLQRLFHGVMLARSNYSKLSREHTGHFEISTDTVSLPVNSKYNVHRSKFSRTGFSPHSLSLYTSVNYWTIHKYDKISKYVPDRFKNLINSSLVQVRRYTFTKFHENLPITFWVISQTVRHTNNQRWKQYLHPEVKNQRSTNGVWNQLLRRCLSHMAVSRTGLHRTTCSQTLVQTKPSRQTDNSGHRQSCLQVTNPTTLLVV